MLFVYIYIYLYVFIICRYYIYITCTLHLHYMYITCTLHIHYIYITSGPAWPGRGLTRCDQQTESAAVEAANCGDVRGARHRPWRSLSQVAFQQWGVHGGKYMKNTWNMEVHSGLIIYVICIYMYIYINKMPNSKMWNARGSTGKHVVKH